MNIKKIAIIGAVALGSLSTTVFADVLNGSFEDGVSLPAPGTFRTLITGNTDIDGWTVLGGSIDWIDDGYWEASDGLRSIDLDGDSEGGISQTFDTIPGYKYKVTFDLAGNPEGPPTIKTVQVSAVGASLTHSELFLFDVTGKSIFAMGWSSQIMMFKAVDPTTTLSFISQTGGAWGPAIDNVHVAKYVPTTADECKKGGWKVFEIFKNQGDCVSFVATKQKNQPSGVNP